MNTEEEQYFEVNIDEILYHLIHKLRIILLTGVICAVSVFIYMEFISTPVYISSTSVLIDVQSKQLDDEYCALVFSSEVLDNTLEDLQLNCTPDELKEKITATAQAETRILYISAADSDPEMAKMLAETVREYSISLIKKSRGIQNFRVLNEADVPKFRSDCSVKKITVFAGGAGAFCAAFVIILMTILRSTVCTPEQVKRYTGLDTLGLIPYENDGFLSSGNTNRKKRGMRKS